MQALLSAFHAAVVDGVDAPGLVVDDGARARLAVYAHAYIARIAGVLAADYPKLQAWLGAEAFAALVGPYLRAHPTRHPSLREAGVHLPAFLDGAPADLARLERARTEVFDGPDAAPLAREAIAALAPDAFPALSLRLVPASAVVELATTADEVWSAVEDGAAAPAVRPEPRTVLVWRRDLAVVHRTLDADEAPAIRRIAAGACFADVCEQLAPERALALLVRWLDAAILLDHG